MAALCDFLDDIHCLEHILVRIFRAGVIDHGVLYAVKGDLFSGARQTEGCLDMDIQFIRVCRRIVKGRSLLVLADRVGLARDPHGVADFQGVHCEGCLCRPL